jgi:hypothetical protein
MDVVKNGEQEHTTEASMRILELENRCTGTGWTRIR